MLNKLDGCYTRLLRIVHCVDWTAGIRNTYLYGNGLVPPISTTIAKRSLKFAGHAFRAKDQPIPDLILWEPNPRSAKLYYVKTLCQYTGASKDELKTLMEDREVEVHLGRVRQAPHPTTYTKAATCWSLGPLLWHNPYQRPATLFSVCCLQLHLNCMCKPTLTVLNSKSGDPNSRPCRIIVFFGKTLCSHGYASIHSGVWTRLRIFEAILQIMLGGACIVFNKNDFQWSCKFALNYDFKES